MEREKIKEVIYSKFNNDCFMQWLKMEILELEVGYAKSRIPLAKDTLNSYGYIHGGALYALADMTAGIAAGMRGYHVVTAEGKLNYLEPAKDTEFIYCIAKALREGKHMQFYETRLYDDKGNLVDEGSFTFFNTGVSYEEDNQEK